MKRLLLLFALTLLGLTSSAQQMMFSDDSRPDRPFAKDPHVINWGDHYLMYYSLSSDNGHVGWGIGVTVCISSIFIAILK